MSIPLEINITLKDCPICKSHMLGETSQTANFFLWFEKIINQNKTICPACGYTEKFIQEYPKKAIKLAEAYRKNSVTNLDTKVKNE